STIAGMARTNAAEPTRIEGMTYAGEPVAPIKFQGDLRELPAPLKATRTMRPYRPRGKPPGPTKLPPPGPRAEEVQPPAASLAPMPAPTQNFAGIKFGDACAGGQCGAGWPPDPNGDVGANHYIQAVNDAYAIYSKSGALLAAFTEDQLWSGIGNSPCNGNSQGDPVVLYDALADRWILSHFAFAYSGSNSVSPFYQCIAVSQSGDPVAGGWYFYAVQTDPGGAGRPPVGTFNDY